MLLMIEEVPDDRVRLGCLTKFNIHESKKLLIMIKQDKNNERNYKPL